MRVNADATRRPAASAMVGIGLLKGPAPSPQALRCRLFGGTEAHRYSFALAKRSPEELSPSGAV
jgi:hypothetical protein